MDSDDVTFASAKVRDYLEGEIKDNDELYPHAGYVDGEASDLMSFMESLVRSEQSQMSGSFADTELGKAIYRKNATNATTKAVTEGNASLLSFAVGLTEKEVDVSMVQAFSKIQSSLLNFYAPYIGAHFGSMNFGKTNFVLTYSEIWREIAPLKYPEITDANGEVIAGLEPVVVTNIEDSDGGFADYTVQEYDAWRDLVLGDERYFDSGGLHGKPPEIDPKVPVFWLFDECSSHLDARTKSYPVSKYYLPALKRFAKVNVDGWHIGHSTRDIYPDILRENIVTEVVVKTNKTTAEVYEYMSDGELEELRYELENIQPTGVEYDPDDYSPWSWPE